MVEKSAFETLKAARGLITDVNKWTQKFYARNKDGLPCGPTHPDAVRFCSIGAMYAVTGKNTYGSVIDYLYKAVNQLAEPKKEAETWGLAEYNDTHTHAEVLEVYDLAIEMAEGTK